MNEILKSQKGTSLIEILVGLVVAAIIMAGAVNIMAMSVKTEHRATEKETSMQAVRGALTLISDEVQSATTISEPAYSKSAANSANTISYTNQGDTCSISAGTGVDKNKVIIQNGSKIRKIPAMGIKPLTFTRDTADPRKVTIKIEADNGTGSDFNLETTIITLNNL